MKVLSKEEVCAAIERKGGHSRIPVHKLKWYNPETIKKYGEELTRIDRKYPDDVVQGAYPQPDWETLSQATVRHQSGFDSRIIIADYNHLDEVVAKICQFGQDLDMTDAVKKRQENPDQYCLGYTWFALYERLWMLLGMQNVLLGFGIILSLKK